MSQPTYHILLIDYSHSFSPQITRRKHVRKNYHLTSVWEQKKPQRQELTLRTHIKYYIYVYLFIYEPS